MVLPLQKQVLCFSVLHSLNHYNCQIYTLDSAIYSLQLKYTTPDSAIYSLRSQQQVRIPYTCMTPCGAFDPPTHYSIYTIVSRKYAPPFATLALVQKAGGAYTRDTTISLAITPSLPGMKSLSGGGWRPSVGRRRARGGEMLTTLAVG